MNKRWIGFLLLLLLSLTSVALAVGTPTVDWDVIGNGGGHIEATPYNLDYTIGQAVVGIATNTNDELCSGYWCGAVEAAPPLTATPTPTSTAHPTATPTSTATPTGTLPPAATPTSTAPPTATPTGTVTPPAHLIYLPLVMR